MKLFKYEGYNLTISEEAMLLKPFKALWKRDKSRNKEKALMELGYIYFMEDPRSDYQVYVDEEERATQIKLGEGMDNSWQPDEKVLEAQKFYAGFKSASALLAEDIRYAINNLRRKVRTLDLDAEDDKGKPKYTIDSYVRAIGMVPALIIKLDEAEKAIARDIAQNDKVRGAAEKAMFEDD